MQKTWLAFQLRLVIMTTNWAVLASDSVVGKVKMGILPGQPAIAATTTFRNIISSLYNQCNRYLIQKSVQLRTGYLTYHVNTPLILGDNSYPGLKLLMVHGNPSKSTLLLVIKSYNPSQVNGAITDLNSVVRHSSLTPKSYTADLKRIYGRRDGILDGNERTSDAETLQKIRKNIVQRFGPDPLVHNRHQGEHH
jgi:hypothetical protein